MLHYPFDFTAGSIGFDSWVVRQLSSIILGYKVIAFSQVDFKAVFGKMHTGHKLEAAGKLVVKFLSIDCSSVYLSQLYY